MLISIKWDVSPFSFKVKGEYDKAIADFAEVIKLKPNYAYAYFQRGLCKRSNKNLDGAIADFSEAKRIYPNYADAFYWRAMAYGGKARFEEARKDFQEALRLAPQAKDIIEPWLKKTEEILSNKK